MSQASSRVIRNLVNSILYTRYLSSVIALLTSLLYALLSSLGAVPLYTTVAEMLGLTPILLLGLFYLACILITSFIYCLWIILPADSLQAQLAWRPIIHSTDRTGLLLVNLLLVAGVGVATWVAVGLFSNQYMRESIIFLAVVVCLPLLLDFVQRPPRLRIGANEHSPLAIAYRLSAGHVTPENVLNTLAIYNDLDPNDPLLAGPDLPEGMLLDIPAKF